MTIHEVAVEIAALLPTGKRSDAVEMVVRVTIEALAERNEDLPKDWATKALYNAASLEGNLPDSIVEADRILAKCRVLREWFF